MARPTDASRFGMSKDEWEKIEAPVRKWMKANKDDWEALNKSAKEYLIKLKDISKQTGANATKVHEFADLQKTIVSNARELLKDETALKKIKDFQASSATEYEKALNRNNKLGKRQMGTLESTADISNRVIQNAKAVGTEEFETLNITKLIMKAKRENLPNTVTELEYLKTQQDRLKIIHDQATMAADAIGKPIEAFKTFLEGLPGGQFLASILGLDVLKETLKDAFKEGVGESAKSVFKEAGDSIKKGFLKPLVAGVADIGKKFLQLPAATKALIGGSIIMVGLMGKMLKNAFDLATSTGLSADQINEMGPMAAFAGDEVKALVAEFGNTEEITSKALFSMKMMAFWTGVEATDLAKIAVLQTAVTDMSLEESLNRIKSWQNLAKAEKVSGKMVISDIASQAEYFSMFMKDGGDNIAKAAIEARKMGLELSNVESISKKLLDWESSIESEMEASVLLGRQLNFDRARQLAFAGKHVEMMREIKIQTGGEAEFSRMNAIQREAVADAVGLTTSQLSELMKNQEAATEASNAFKWTWVSMGAIIGGIIGMIAGGLAFVTNGFSLAAIGSMIGMGVVAAAAGGLLMAGVAGGAKLAGFDKPGTVTEGGLAKVDRGDVYTGEGGFDLTPMTTLQKDTNASLKSLYLQQETLMKKLISVTSDIGTLS